MFSIICAIISVVCGCICVGFVLVGWEHMKEVAKNIPQLHTDTDQETTKNKKTIIRLKRDA